MLDRTIFGIMAGNGILEDSNSPILAGPDESTRWVTAHVPRLAWNLLLAGLLVVGFALGFLNASDNGVYLYTAAVCLFSGGVCLYVSQTSKRSRSGWRLLGVAQSIRAVPYLAAVLHAKSVLSYAAGAWLGNAAIAAGWCCFLLLSVMQPQAGNRPVRIVNLLQISIFTVTVTLALGSGQTSGDGDTRVWVVFCCMGFLSVAAWCTTWVSDRQRHLRNCVALYLSLSTALVWFINIASPRLHVSDAATTGLFSFAEICLCYWALHQPHLAPRSRFGSETTQVLTSLQQAIFTTGGIGVTLFAMRFHYRLAFCLTLALLLLLFVRIHFEHMSVLREKVVLSKKADELRHRATRDALTGLSNRWWFEEQASYHLQNSQQMPCTLLMIDTDRFKEINDAQGHLVGDRVLAMIADVLTRVCRQGDCVARIGGDEFAFVSPGANSQTAHRLAEAFRSGVEDLAKARDLPVTVSIGGAVADRPCSLHAAIEAADAALYAVKRNGRNGLAINTMTIWDT